jgi:hypothetical protein
MGICRGPFCFKRKFGKVWAQNRIGLADNIFANCVKKAREVGDHNLFYGTRRAAKTGRRDKNEPLSSRQGSAMEIAHLALFLSAKYLHNASLGIWRTQIEIKFTR